MPVRPLPSSPSLDHLKAQAKDLLRERSARTPASAQRIREFHPRFRRFAADADIFDAAFRLSDAQFAVAREHGFSSWTRLKRRVEQPRPSDDLQLPHHERIESEPFRRAVELLDAGDAAGLRAHLTRHPELVRRRALFEGGNYFRHPSLLEFVAENPVRRGKMPPNIVEVARVILDAGASDAARDETLSLVASGRVARECGAQQPLIDLLCERGADGNAAVQAAIIDGELDALAALLLHGARADLAVAAALGRTGEFYRLLPGASGEERQYALAVAAQYNRVEFVRSLLHAGVDPSRYNPVGGHSHATCLHQAALAGHDELVRLLVENGAKLNSKDLLWHATPADWAQYEGKTEVEEYLRAKEAQLRPS